MTPRPAPSPRTPTGEVDPPDLVDPPDPPDPPDLADPPDPPDLPDLADPPDLADAAELVDAPSRADLADLGERLGRVEGQLAEFHRRSAHREAVIDRLHEENQRLSGGLGRAILEPVVADLIRLYDQLDREVRRLDADGQDARLLWSFAEDVAQILDRCGLELFSAQPGDPFERDRHRPLGVVACDDESRQNTVAEVIAVGFCERDTGRIRRPVQARFYQLAPGQGAARREARSETGPSSDAAQSQ